MEGFQAAVSQRQEFRDPNHSWRVLKDPKKEKMGPPRGWFVPLNV